MTTQTLVMRGRTAKLSRPARIVALSALAIGAIATAAPAHAQAVTPHRAVCDPIRWSEHVTPVVSVRPRQCGYWGVDGNGPMAAVVGLKRLHWSTWGATAKGRGWTVPNRPGQGEKPTRVVITLSRPRPCYRGLTGLRVYTRERVRTRYGTATFSMRAATEYCDKYPDVQGRFKTEVITGEERDCTYIPFETNDPAQFLPPGATFTGMDGSSACWVRPTQVAWNASIAVPDLETARAVASGVSHGEYTDIYPDAPTNGDLELELPLRDAIMRYPGGELRVAVPLW